MCFLVEAPNGFAVLIFVSLSDGFPYIYFDSSGYTATAIGLLWRAAAEDLRTSLAAALTDDADIEAAA